MKPGLLHRKIGPLLLILVMIYVAWHAGRVVVKGMQTHSWQQTTGVITTSSLLDRPIKQVVSALVLYQYEFAAKSYSGAQIDCDEHVLRDFDSRTEAQTFIDNYPAGQDVVVHVDPAEPSSAVLEVGVPSSAWVYVILSVLVGAFAARRLLQRTERATAPPTTRKRP
ncbi:MAG: hypothetical protein ACI9SE_000583 [Neolewinella sp.]|jgi:hypothetical protein